MTRFVESADGTRIAYDAVGEGPAVVFVHGAAQFRASDATTTDTAQRLAAKGFTVVTYDRRGRGESTDTPPYTVSGEVQDLEAVIEAVGGSAAVFGSSSGAVLALWAAQAQIGITKLVLWEPPLTLEDDGQAFLAGLKEKVAAKDRDGAIAFFMGEVQEEWLDALRQSPAYPAIWSIAPTLPYDAEVLASSLTGTPWEQQWDRVTVPTLILVGEQTLEVFPPAANKLHRALPHAAQRRLSSEQQSWRSQLLAGALAEALTPYAGCAWPCEGCEADRAAATPARAVNPSGPVPVYDDEP